MRPAVLLAAFFGVMLSCSIGVVFLASPDEPSVTEEIVSHGASVMIPAEGRYALRCEKCGRDLARPQYVFDYQFDGIAVEPCCECGALRARIVDLSR